MSQEATESSVRSPSGKILFLPHLDVLAHTGRSLLVAEELAKRGWTVAFAGEGKYARLVRESGLEVFALPELPAQSLVIESKRGKRWPFHSAEQIRPFVAAETELLGTWRPDAVVFDHRYTAGTSAEAAGIPRVSITNLWWTRYDAVGMGLPETHPLFSAAPWLAFVRRFAVAAKAGEALTRMMFRRWTRPYNIVRAEYGLGPIESILDLFGGDAVVLPDTPQFMPAKGLPPNYHYVGPLVWEPGEGAAQATIEDSPYVYVTMGSSADPQVFDAVIEAMKLLDTPAVVTTGGVRRAEEFSGLPKRIQVYDFLKGSAAVAHAYLVVCQGGIGTIYQALAAGKPLLGIPFMPEQEVYGIGQVVKIGAGRGVSARGLTPERLARAIRQVQEDPKCSEAAQKAAKWVDLSSGPGKAADVVEAVVNKSYKKIQAKK